VPEAGASARYKNQPAPSKAESSKIGTSFFDMDDLGMDSLGSELRKVA
jgi:hypothetical protein